MKSQIQIQFPVPGVWDKFTLTAVYCDADGYTHTDTYTQDDIPADQAPALVSVVSALVGLAEPWQAVQVWARVEDIIASIAYDPEFGPPDTIEAVCLTVEAVNASGGHRTFTAADYSDFVITDSDAIVFFNYFTGARV